MSTGFAVINRGISMRHPRITFYLLATFSILVPDSEPRLNLQAPRYVRPRISAFDFLSADP
jgi:hypothetical protein